MRQTLILLTLTAAVSAFAQGPYRSAVTYDSYEGLVMAGYQGWFNTPGDGALRGWHHYEKWNRFEPGWCTIDLWPEVSEYPDLYETAFTFDDGTYASVPSAYDYSTVDVHFRWMQEYGLDGVFLQRFVAEIANPSGKKHFNKVMASAMECANRYDRAVAIMYDLSGMSAKGPDIVLKDIDALAKAHHLFDHEANPSYLYQNGKPLVAVWGVGFNDNRQYGFDACGKIIDGLKKKGYSVLIGVPTHWRDLTDDTLPDGRLHALIRKCDVVMPWFVGRYNEQTYPDYHQLIRDDMAWAEREGIAYAPLCFPGFSWANMQRRGHPGVQIPRNKGAFFQKQLDFCLEAGARMLYIAMFDEIDEGTAIYKIARKVPVAAPGSTFVPLEDGVPPDRYLSLAGEAAARLKGKVADIPAYVNPVIDADVPDPTVIRVGDTYYAAGTSGNQESVYPLFRSRDLVNWERLGFIFDAWPSWAMGDFWAPELLEYKGKYYCYYTARDARDGISCIGVATAERPEGPYTDYGPVVKWGREAIDPFLVEEDGVLYITWKAYGLDPDRPIEILGSALSEDGLRLAGDEVFTLTVDDRNIGMEGQCLFRKDGFLYLLYSARDCCSRSSDYEVRVARARNLRGPYAYCGENPILRGDGTVIQSCGHGTPVTTPDGRMFYLCHAYFVGKYDEGRKPILQELETGPDGWPRFTAGNITVF